MHQQCPPLPVLLTTWAGKASAAVAAAGACRWGWARHTPDSSLGTGSLAAGRRPGRETPLLACMSNICLCNFCTTKQEVKEERVVNKLSSPLSVKGAVSAKSFFVKLY